MKKKFFDISLITAASVLLAGLGIGILVPRESSFSEEENRVLAELKKPTAESVISGEFSENIGAFANDRLPFRLSFIRTRVLCELLLLKGESNGVIFARNGYLLKRGEYDSVGIAQNNFSYLGEILQMCRENGTPAVSAIVPRGIDVMSSRLPPMYSGGEAAVWQLAADNGGTEYVNLTEPLRNAAEKGEYVWYKTDHHWTSAGAYIAYRELSKALEYKPYSHEHFQPETVSDSFLGSVYSSAGCLAPSADSVELYRYRGDGDYTVEIKETGELHRGLYYPERLSEKDKYLVFLGGNYSELSVTGEGKRQRLLLIKDSYANSLVPFLALHYDIELLDLRYYRGGKEGMSEKIRNADRVLLLHGIDTLATTALY